MRKQFTFYKSFDDVYQGLNDKQRLEFMSKMLDVQFLRVHVDDISFDDVILKHIWNAQKHTVGKSIYGYLDSQKSEKIKHPFFGVYDTHTDTLGGYLEPPKEGKPKQHLANANKPKQEVANLANAKSAKKEKGEFSFQLDKPKHVSELDSEYIEKLTDYIDNGKKEMCTAVFLEKCNNKNYKYDNYKKTYDDWNRNMPNVQKIGGYTIG